MASAMVAVKQAQIGQQAALKAAELVMDVEQQSGTRLVEDLIKSANAMQQAADGAMLDVLA